MAFLNKNYKLYNACKDGKCDEVEARLQQEDEASKSELFRKYFEISQNTLLHVAAINGHAQLVRLLLNHGANVNVTTGAGRYTPLHVAASAGKKECVQILLEHQDIVLNRVDEHGNTPYQAFKGSRSQTIPRLIKSEEIIKAAKNNHVKHLDKALRDVEKTMLTEGCLSSALKAAVCKDRVKTDIIFKILSFAAGNSCFADLELMDCVQLVFAQDIFNAEIAALLVLCCLASAEEEVWQLGYFLGISTEEWLLCQSRDGILDQLEIIHPQKCHQIRELLKRKTCVDFAPAINIALACKHSKAAQMLLGQGSMYEKMYEVRWKSLGIPYITAQLIKGIHHRGPLGDCDWKSITLLDLRRNNLETIPSTILHLPLLGTLYLDKNKLKELPKIKWISDSLNHLYLSQNQLTQLPSGLGSSNLRTLYLDQNRFTSVPKCVCRIAGLETLDISGNQLEWIRLEIGLLSKLITFKFDNSKIVSPPGISGYEVENTKELVTRLRSLLTEMKPFTMVKLLVVGWQDKGKTTLVRRLEGNFKYFEREVTPGVEVSEFHMQEKKMIVVPIGPKVRFQVWDFAGQEDFYLMHMCFLSSVALYLLVWNLQDGEGGIEELKTWLDNIECRAMHRTSIIIVGTHLDCIPEKQAKAYTERMRRIINRMVEKRSKDKINIVAVVEVSCHPQQNQGLDGLREKILKASKEIVKDKDVRVLDQPVPISFHELVAKIEKMRNTMWKNKELPILTLDQLWSLVKETLGYKKNRFLEEEFKEAVEFLKDRGVILHFDDPNQDLRELYFIDPGWLFTLMTKAITSQSSNDGLVRKDSLFVENKEASFTEKSRDRGILLLSRFHVVHVLDNDNLLIPSKFSKTRPKKNLLEDEKRLRRIYRMEYLPHGFFSRLIARLFHYLDSMIVEAFKDQEIMPILPTLPDQRPLIPGLSSPPSSSHQMSTPAPRSAHSAQSKTAKQRQSQFSPSWPSLPPPVPTTTTTGVLVTTTTTTTTEPTTASTVKEIGNVKTAIVTLSPSTPVSVSSSSPSTPPPAETVGVAGMATITPAKISSIAARGTALTSSSSLPAATAASTTPSPLEVLACKVSTPSAAATASSSSSSSAATSEATSSSSSSAAAVSLPSSSSSSSSVSQPPAMGSASRSQSKQSSSRQGPPIPHQHSSFSAATTITNLRDADILHWWRNGIKLNLPDAYLEVTLLQEAHESPCIEIKTSRSVPGRRLLVFTIEHVEALITEWFYGLREGKVSQVIPCVVCEDQGLQDPNVFTLADCLRASKSSDCVDCPKHNCVPVPISDIAPDISLHDVHPDLLFQHHQLYYDDNCNIKEGSFGKVYFAVLKKPTGCRKHVAIKEFKGDDLTSFRELRKEINVLRRVVHPNLVQMIGVASNPKCIAMELAEGSLEGILFDKDSERIPRLLLISIAKEIASALAVLHWHKIIHRDLKPSNVLVFSLNEDDAVHVKVSDFGTANFTGPCGMRAPVTRTHMRAPEVLEFALKEEYSIEVDIYSFGILLLAMITRKRAFNDLPSNDIRSWILEHKRPSWRHEEGAMNKLVNLTRLMCVSWNQSPKDRPKAVECQKQLENPGFQALMSKLAFPPANRVFFVHFVSYTEDLWVVHRIDNYTFLSVFTGSFSSNNKHCFEISVDPNVGVEAVCTYCDMMALTLRKGTNRTRTIKMYLFTESSLLASVDCDALPDVINGIAATRTRIFIASDSGCFAVDIGDQTCGSVKTAHQSTQKPVHSILVTKSKLWMAGQSCVTVYSLLMDSQFETFYDPKECVIKGIHQLQHAQIEQDTIWVVTDDCIMMLNAEDQILSWLELKDLFTSQNIPVQSNVTCLLPTSDTLWLGLSTGFIVIIDIHTRQVITSFRPYTEAVRYLVSSPDTQPPTVISCGRSPGTYLGTDHHHSIHPLAIDISEVVKVAARKPSRALANVNVNVEGNWDEVQRGGFSDVLLAWQAMPCKSWSRIQREHGKKT